MTVGPPSRRLALPASILVVALLIVSLLVPAVGTCEPNGSVHEAPSSLDWLATGWLGPPFGIFGWYANPALLFAMKPWLDRRSPTLLRAILPPALAATIPVQPSFNYLDSPTFYHFCRPSLGLWCWVAALCVPLAVVVLDRLAGSSKG